METIRVDVLVIGSGSAGLRAAIAAAEEGCDTLLVSKGTPGLGSATILSDGFFASSGIAMDADEHARLTLETGYNLNRPELVRILAEETPACLEEAGGHGLVFAREPGGMRAPRVRLGNIVVPHVLMRWAVSAGVRCMGSTTIVELLKDGDRVVGCMAIAGGRLLLILAKATALCTGGASAVYLSHDNPTTNLGDGYALACRAGIALHDMEFVQFYPLVTGEPGKPRVLVGPPFADIGMIINDGEEDLVEKYGLGMLKPLGMKARDRLSRALFQELLSGRRVFLDLRSMTEKDWRHPGAAGEGVRAFYENVCCSRSKPVPVMPAAHFTMGGIAIDEFGGTELKGLFAAGELVWGLHGANRMGGNALSETLVFGRRAGRSAADEARSRRHRQKSVRAFFPEFASAAGLTPSTALRRLREIMWRCGGPVRTADGLARGLELLDDLDKEGLTYHGIGQAATAASVKSALAVARCIIASAQSRSESIGAHYRED